MISSIFGKTKPINFIIVLAFLFLFYWSVHFLMFQRSYVPEELLRHTIVLSILLFSIFVVNFIVKRNQITGTNSYAILFYALLIVVFQSSLLDNNVVLCSFFLLLAQRRLISLRSLKNVKLKILDATLWVTVASFFYDWALLYLILVFIAIYFYEPKNIRNWLIPFLGVFAVGVILYSVLLLIDEGEFFKDHYSFNLSFDTNFYAYWGNSIKLVVYIIIILLTGFWAFLKIGKLGIGRIMTMRLIAISFTIGIVLTLLKTSSETFPVMVTFFSAAILLSKYIEVIKKVNIKEIALMISIFIPFVVLLTEWIVK